ncbi:hypothetical protein KLP40_04655 [Hymenobacter sp. NST-14]|uniref:TapB family protein n=1 Tax=Hymenobacter piscis TaxID=2839984 RepID=UPI001C0171F6|nr:hypothetical protein [Hymenobacter piscis]MBT9392446.1 hypothetical protein [Hymenobacter piscis]
MRPLVSSLVWLSGTLLAPALMAQTPPDTAADCPHPFGLYDNTELVYQRQDERGKLLGTLRQRVVNLGSEQNKKQTLTTNTVLLKSGSYNAKNRLLYLRDLTFRCRRDTAFTDGLAQLNPEQLSSFRDRILTYSPTPLAWPNQPTVGSELPDGGISVDVRSSAVHIAEVYAKVQKRKVTGQESITTPAGTFACFKVEAEQESATVARADMVLRTTTRLVDYYSPAVGLVRTELYDKKGRLTEVRLLTAINKGGQTVDKVKYKVKKS